MRLIQRFVNSIKEKWDRDRRFLTFADCFGGKVTEEGAKRVAAFMVYDKFGDDATEEEKAVSSMILLEDDLDVDKLLDDPEILDFRPPTPEQREEFMRRLDAEVARIQAEKREKARSKRRFKII